MRYLPPTISINIYEIFRTTYFTHHEYKGRFKIY